MQLKSNLSKGTQPPDAAFDNGVMCRFFIVTIVFLLAGRFVRLLVRGNGLN